MSTENQNVEVDELDALTAALLQPTIDLKSDKRVAVNAIDAQGEGYDFSQIFFEPVVGNSYIFKVLPNIGGDPISHRSVYKNLPDPHRKGKKFHYTSSGDSKTCKALDLFFELNDLKKAGDTEAKMKIDDYMSRSAEGCVKIQILASPKAEEIGIIRLFKFGTAGPNPYISTLFDAKLNPTKNQIAAGNGKEDVFDIFSSAALVIECIEEHAEGQKFRSFKGSSWSGNKRGAMVKLPDGTIREFSAADRNGDGSVKPEVVPFFRQFAKELQNPNTNIVEHFLYKTPDDPRITESTAEHIRKTLAKVAEIVPIIRNKSVQEIAAYGVVDDSTAQADPNAKAPRNILAESVPAELAGMITQQTAPPTQAPAAAAAAPSASASAQSVLDAIV